MSLDLVSLASIASSLQRIADALEKSSKPPSDGILEAYTAAADICLDAASAADYIQQVYGESRERAQKIVDNCKPQNCEDEPGVKQ